MLRWKNGKKVVYGSMTWTESALFLQPSFPLLRYCSRPPLDTEELLQSRQPNSVQSLQHLRVNLVHPWRLELKKPLAWVQLPTIAPRFTMTWMTGWLPSILSPRVSSFEPKGTEQAGVFNKFGVRTHWDFCQLGLHWLNWKPWNICRCTKRINDHQKLTDGFWACP